MEEKAPSLKRTGQKNHIVQYSLFLLLVVLSALWLIPFYILMVNSFKEKDIEITGFPLNLPENFSVINFIEGIAETSLFNAAVFSLIVTVGSVTLIVLFSGIAAWMLVRVKGTVSTIIFFTFVAAMLVPFQSVMFPMVRIASALGLLNPIGIMFIYMGFGSSLSIFLFHGFIKGIPFELEEAATIDGCNPLQAYLYVVFPMLKPISITVAILNTLWIWNDFLLPSLILSEEYATIPMAINLRLVNTYSVEWGLMLANLVVAIAPVIIFYFILQRFIIEGITAGSIK
ncbi:carbohydrate ABC transporter permease [Haloplasma contractile]|uniref:ABC-type transporter permease component protein n=1 Tax=Haloplasma contractile SSD-17B TaxID=1033810 RepID=U2EFA7_9MOLU|nr:carbohydrate ABC transporter permease [Haloplasma contractile]ERJ13361.1 ABC-type transporter permease component protein [Haloplasma contractile SSD-17B]